MNKIIIYKEIIAAVVLQTSQVRFLKKKTFKKEKFPSTAIGKQIVVVVAAFHTCTDSQ